MLRSAFRKTSINIRAFRDSSWYWTKLESLEFTSFEDEDHKQYPLCCNANSVLCLLDTWFSLDSKQECGAYSEFVRIFWTVQRASYLNSEESLISTGASQNDSITSYISSVDDENQEPSYTFYFGEDVSLEEQKHFYLNSSSWRYQFRGVKMAIRDCFIKFYSIVSLMSSHQNTNYESSRSLYLSVLSFTLV